MRYIIENIHLLKRQRVKKTSILIEDNRVELMRDTFNSYQYMRMDGSPYMMAPTTVMLDNHVTRILSYTQQKQYIEENLIKKGCTTLLFYLEVNRERELPLQVKKMKTPLLNCAIDFVAGVKIPLKLLSPSFIRGCKREKIPVIFIEVEDVKALYRVPWGWIKEALFPYNAPLVPIFLTKDQQEKKIAQKMWSSLMRDVKIPSIPHEIKEGIAIAYPDLVKMGIYPFKGNIYQGGEVTYNLFAMDDAIINIEENDLFHYHYDRIQMTIHKGKCIRAGDKVFYRPGFGELLEVKVPSFLTV
ncbi:hypothetical protein C2I06_08215 [Niallia circulans]|nr:hypothetical protein [Niallia circulans]AYV66858.1 hypothetical protein C2I06_08215 [Niallia circulans]QJX62748.1 hypothetical protein HLK66_14560 [Niallia circulans]